MKSKFILSIICIITGVLLGIGAFYITNNDEKPVIHIDNEVSDFISVELKENLPIKIEDTTTSPTAAQINSLKAGEIVAENMLDMNNIESYFVESPISDEILRRIKGKSYPEGCPVPLESLKYIRVLHYGANNNIYTGELIVNKDISQDITEIFKQLFLNKYPIEKIRLVDEYNADDEASMKDNNTSCFNYRIIAGTDSVSNHSFGRAIDINPLYNPYVAEKNGVKIVSPVDSQPYVNRNSDFNYKIDKNDLCYKLFTQYGFQWGGDWSNVKDYQHFEK